jgi:hypothetical protein
MVCTACGLIGADIRPDWTPHTGDAWEGSPRLSPEPAAFIKKIRPEPLTIRPGTFLQEWVFQPVDEDIRRVAFECHGAADRTDTGDRHSDGNHHSDDQLGDAAWHDPSTERLDE